MCQIAEMGNLTQEKHAMMGLIITLDVMQTALVLILPSLVLEEHQLLPQLATPFVAMAKFFLQRCVIREQLSQDVLQIALGTFLAGLAQEVPKLKHQHAPLFAGMESFSVLKHAMTDQTILEVVTAHVQDLL